MQINLATVFLLLAAGYHAVEANRCLYTDPRKCSQGCPNGACPGGSPDDVTPKPAVPSPIITFPFNHQSS
ncbi:putative Septin spn3 [Fusarium oxysporum f. sp. albedinis]|nr:putative Septin spn3 [Fusarium oxysporum f. sp. albedinis]